MNPVLPIILSAFDNLEIAKTAMTCAFAKHPQRAIHLNVAITALGAAQRELVKALIAEEKRTTKETL